MATSPHTPADEVEDVYAGLMAELDAMVGSAEPEAGQDENLEQALADHAAESAEVDTGVAHTTEQSSEPSPSHTTPAAPANSQVENQVESLVRANIEKMQLEQQLQANAAELEKLRAERTTKSKPDYFDGEVTDLTPEELDAYADTTPTIRKLINAELKRYDAARVKQVMEDATALREHLGQVEQHSQHTALEAFGMAVNTAIPGIGSKMRTAEWATFMKQPAPYSAGSGATMQTLWEYAERTRNIQAMAEIANGVQLKQDPVANMVAPGSSRAPAPQARAPLQKTVPYSQYTEAIRKQQSGELSWEKFQAFQDKFLAAEAAGLVDENA